jgi:hypothetical protein
MSIQDRINAAQAVLGKTGDWTTEDSVTLNQGMALQRYLDAIGQVRAVLEMYAADAPAIISDIKANAEYAALSALLGS